MGPSTDTPLVLTQGDPRGIGSELLLRLAAEGELREGDVVVGSPSWLERWAGALPQPWAAAGWARVRACLHPIDEEEPGAAQVRVLERAVDLVQGEPRRALVTAPIDKAGCRDEGFAFPGHTEYLAARAQVDDFAMLMVGPTLRVVLATIHIPLREVPLRLDVASIVRAGTLLALPVMMALLAVNIAFGVLARAAAQLNPIAIGLPVSLLVGLALLMLLMQQLQSPVDRLFGDAFTAARALTG